MIGEKVMICDMCQREIEIGIVEKVGERESMICYKCLKAILDDMV